MGIIGGKLLGPIIFDGQLTAERYLQFLRNQINDFIEDLPLANEVDIYIQQDGAPPHNSQVVVEHLNDTFSGKVDWHFWTHSVACEITRSYSARFFLWGTIKNQVYNTTSATREKLEHKVRVTFQNITEAQLINVMRPTIKLPFAVIKEEAILNIYNLKGLICHFLAIIQKKNKLKWKCMTSNYS
ncbi:uncharacterized protein isoform X1 [Leptinotarsa decemlineata]|uniref:uncharacterized protein isoform X1 n=1 Tax=Leptinotarsa decemlineata TaxID=7539 RepID=UPI003D30BDE1